jgi:hypothetical protein
MYKHNKNETHGLEHQPLQTHQYSNPGSRGREVTIFQGSFIILCLITIIGFSLLWFKAQTWLCLIGLRPSTLQSILFYGENSTDKLSKVQFYAAAQHTLVNQAQLLCFMGKNYY